ncbi:hypothetical protein WMY93_028329 [Mugilogobius chulae]|uniref:Ubiquitin-like domain-containing protein n=1 Tax=Mugilogobius chulae TaxID=88201 RepID=A0AAW0MP17_9GOBI
MCLQLKVNSPQGNLALIEVCKTQDEFKNITVKQLIDMIVWKMNAVGKLRAVYQGKELEESYTLESYNIKHMSTIQTAVQLDGGR